jgi:hypothetical protein
MLPMQVRPVPTQLRKPRQLQATTLVARQRSRRSPRASLPGVKSASPPAWPAAALVVLVRLRLRVQMQQRVQVQLQVPERRRLQAPVPSCPVPLSVSVPPAPRSTLRPDLPAPVQASE